MKKTLVIVAVVLLLGVAVFSALSATNEGVEHEQSGEFYMQYAEEQLEMGGYGSAIDYINAAIEVNPKIERYLKLAEVYREAGSEDDFEDVLEKVIELYPSDKRAYKSLANYYFDQMAYAKCVEILKSASTADCLDDEMLEQYFTAAYYFTVISVPFEEAQAFYGDYALVMLGGEANFITPGMISYYGIFDDASPAVGGVVAACKDDHWSFYSADSLKYMESEEEVLRAWSITNNLALVQKEKGYCYLNTHGVEVLGPYEDACSFYEGVAAVKKDGKWHLIGTDGGDVADAVFQNVLISEDNICCYGGVIFADSGNGYDMYGSNGQLISETHFEDAQLFYTGKYAAVKVGGKWGFVDAEGNMVIEPKYEDARSFGKSIAAVCEDGLWGFITSSERLVIDYQFLDAKGFGTSDCAPVKVEDGWVYIKINT